MQVSKTDANGSPVWRIENDNHIGLNATTQDVLTAIPLEECFDPDHPCTHTQCREARSSSFEYYRELGWAINSECPSDWAAPLLDSFQVAASPALGGSQDSARHGIPVPLLRLVLHDCLFVLGGSVDRPALALSGANSFHVRDEVLRRLHTETAYMPLTAHSLLSENGMHQEPVLADSVRVDADIEYGNCRITGLAGGEINVNASE